MLLGLAIASFGVSWRRDLLAVFDQLHIQVLAAYDKAKRMEQSSSRSSGGPSPRGFPGGIPGIVDMSQTVLDMLAVFDQQQILAALVDDFPGLPLAPMDASRLSELRRFAEACKKDPSLRADPNLAFSKQAQAPKPQTSSMDDIDGDDDLNMRDGTPEPDELDEEIVESDLELEGDIVESDHNDPPQKMGDPSIEVTEENRDASQEAKGKLEEAVGHLTKAILLNPLSAIMYGTRASVFIKMEKPVTAIRDANAALEINLDSAKGYKTRGMAYAMLGKWEEAARDLRTASNMDYDDEINAVLKKVEPNAHKIMEHRRKYERLRKERKEKRAERDRLRRRAEAQATYDKAKRKEQSSSRSSGGPSPRGFPGGMPGGGFPGGMPGGGFPGMPGGGGMPRGGFPGGMPGGFPRGAMPGGVPGIGDLSQILNDLLAAFDELQIMAALQDVKNNPASFARHLANPKVRPILEEMMAEINGSQ